MSDFSGLKPNTTKRETSGTSVLKGFKTEVYRMKRIDLRKEAIKILGVYFSYNQEKKDNENFYNIISNIQGALNLWKMRNLTLEGRIVVFKTLAIPKTVFLTLSTKIYQVVTELAKIQKSFFQKNFTLKKNMKQPANTTKTGA